MIFHKLLLFLKLELSRKFHLIAIGLVLTIFTSTIFFAPVTNPVEYSLDYQKNDVYGILDSTQINETNIESRFNGIRQETPLQFELVYSHVTTFQVLYDGLPVSQEIQASVEFSPDNISMLQINPLWYRSTENITVFTDELQLNSLNVEKLNEDHPLGRNFDAILTLPETYRVNLSNFYYGLDIDSEMFRGLNTEEISKNFTDELSSFSTYQELSFGDALQTIQSPVIDTLDQIESTFSTIVLQSFILIVSIIGGLAVLLYFLYQSGLRSDLKYLEIIHHRGYSEADLYKLLPTFYIIFHSIYAGIVSFLIFLITNESTFQPQHAMSVALVIVLSLAAMVNTLREFKKLKPRDATEFELNPTVAEYIFLFLSIISLLVNIYLNVPAFGYINLLLVLVIYFSIGLSAGAIIYKLIQIMREKLVSYSLGKENLSKSHSNLVYFTKIQLRRYRKFLKISILFGIIFVIVVAHLNISYQMSNELDRDTNPAILHGSYPNYQDYSNLDDLNTKHTGLIPTQIIKLGVSMTGMIATSDDIFELFPSLEKEHSNAPALYLRSDLESGQISPFTDIEGVSSLVRVGESNFNLNIDPISYYSFHEVILNQFQFILFVDSDRFNGYNSSMEVLFSTQNIDQLELQNQVEDQLTEPIIWNKLPEQSAFEYSLRSNLEDQINFELIFIIGLLFIAFLGYLEPKVMIQSEVMMMRLRGYVNNASLIGVLKSSFLSFFILLLVSMISNLIILSLIMIFNVIPGIRVDYFSTFVISSSLIASSVWLIGLTLSYYLILKQDVQE